MLIHCTQFEKKKQNKRFVRDASSFLFFSLASFFLCVVHTIFDFFFSSALWNLFFSFHEGKKKGKRKEAKKNKKKHISVRLGDREKAFFDTFSFLYFPKGI